MRRRPRQRQSAGRHSRILDGTARRSFGAGGHFDDRGHRAHPFQRDDTYHKRLADVINKGLFLDPINAVTAPTGCFWTPNDRHRLAAMRRLAGALNRRARCARPGGRLEIESTAA